MTRKEAIKCLKDIKARCERLSLSGKTEPRFWLEHAEAVSMALSALRPVSREQIAKIWPGCDACKLPCNNCESIYAWDRYGKPQECTGCPEEGYKNCTPESQFCEFCGRPLTDEAVEMVMERLEALKDGVD